MARDRRTIRHVVGIALGAYAVAVVLLAIGVTAFEPRSGVLALAAILLPHLCLVALLLVPVAIALRHQLLGASLAILALVAVVRFGPEWVSLPRAADGRGVLTVATWNPLSGGTTPDQVIERLLATDADIVAIQELTPDVADALDSDPRIAERFPDRWLVPEATVLGMGILSAFPMTIDGALAETNALVARVDLGPAGSVSVVNGHPLPGSIGMVASVPATFDGTERDAAIGAIRARTDALLARGERVLVIGDYNVTPAEAAYRTLTDGLLDAHAEAGNGTGWTWRPRRFAGAGIGLIRIDYILGSPELEPIGTELRCDVPGDHCLLIAELAVP